MRSAGRPCDPSVSERQTQENEVVDRRYGRGGIRTPETGFARLTVFKTAAFNRSATLPSAANATGWRSSLRARGRAGAPARVLPPARPDRRGGPGIEGEARLLEPLQAARPRAGAFAPASKLRPSPPGEVAEWLKALAC